MYNYDASTFPTSDHLACVCLIELINNPLQSATVASSSASVAPKPKASVATSSVATSSPARSTLIKSQSTTAAASSAIEESVIYPQSVTSAATIIPQSVTPAAITTTSVEGNKYRLKSEFSPRTLRLLYLSNDPNNPYSDNISTVENKHGYFFKGKQISNNNILISATKNKVVNVADLNFVLIISKFDLDKIGYVQQKYISDDNIMKESKTLRLKCDSSDPNSKIDTSNPINIDNKKLDGEPFTGLKLIKHEEIIYPDIFNAEMISPYMLIVDSENPNIFGFIKKEYVELISN